MGTHKTANFTIAGIDGRNARKAVRDWFPTCTSPRKHVAQWAKSGKQLKYVDCTQHPVGKRIA